MALDESVTTRHAYDSLEALFRDLGMVLSSLETNGFCLLSICDISSASLLRIARWLGHPQSHARANAEGVVGDPEKPAADPAWKEHPAEYRGALRVALSPHTDGSFVDGLCIVNRLPTRIGPPRAIILQCAQTAEEGGANTLVDGRLVLSHAIKEHTEIVQRLFRRGSVTFCRDDQLALDCPVYEDIGGGRLRMRFRFDTTTYAPQWSLPALRLLHEKYHMNPAYQTRFLLQPGDVLIVDNWRMLHARDAFRDGEDPSKRRIVKRVWINDDKPGVLSNVEGAVTVRRAMTVHDHYHIVPAPRGLERTPNSWQAGIPIDDSTIAELNRACGGWASILVSE